MKNTDTMMLNRRKILYAALMGGSSVALAGCGQADRSAGMASPDDDMWAGFDERITERTLAETEKLFGLQFTAAERQQILASNAEKPEDSFFAEQIASLHKRRDQAIPSTLAPATTFDPRLPGVNYRAQDNRVSLYPEGITAMPDDAASIAYASVKSQAQWMAAGQITSRELTGIYMDRIEKYADLLECFVTVTSETALAQADKADRERAAGQVRGPLHGIPYGVKDLFDTAGTLTTWGAEPFKERVAPGDAAIVRRLQEAGAVMLGKTTMGALAWGDVWFGGETRNPWNPKEGSSGSSAGSGSATAAGLCAFAIGTETLGSIVSPADRTGLCGLRPTFGRVSRVGAMALCWSLDKIGPMCRYVEDTALVLGALNGFDVDDVSSIDMGFEYNGQRSIDELVVGYDPSWFEGEDVLPTDKAALEAMGTLGVELTEVTLPDLPITEIMAPLYIESAAAFEELTLSGSDDQLRRQVDNAWPNVFRQARFFSAIDYVQADRLRRTVMLQAQAFFSQVDVVIGPSFGNPMLRMTNYTGQPSLTVRAGFEDLSPRPLFGHPENDTDESLHRVPRSVTLWSKLFEEGVLIQVGRALEAALGVADERPAITSIRRKYG